MKNKIISSESLSVEVWKKFYKLNSYYHTNLQELIKHSIPSDASVLEFGSRGGELLDSLSNKLKAGVEWDKDLVAYAKKKYPKVDFKVYGESSSKIDDRKYDYILLSGVLSNISDVQEFVRSIRKYAHRDTRIIVMYFNFLWKPVLDLAEKMDLKYPQVEEPNWLSSHDINNFFLLEGFENINEGKRFIVTHKIPLISDFVNRYISPLPIINNLSLINYLIYRPKPQRKEYSVSIVIPARNEEGNIKGVLNKIPKLGKKTEVIFVEGHSTDNTYQAIKDEVKRYKGPIQSSFFRQKGVGKGDAVRLGFDKAQNELLMILDADLTVAPKDLPKFYEAAASGLGDFINGSRLVYQMEKQAMRTLNYIGNRFFSLAFSFLLDQRIRDTLCGTKVILKSNYQKIKSNRKIFGDFDPFGDFDLLFGAAKLNLRIIEVPIRYRERIYGQTNISRFRHGLLLLRMVVFAARKIKFI